MFALESYEKAGSVAEAIALLARDPGAAPVAGGTDVLVRLREGHAGCRRLVDIHGLTELQGTRLEEEGTLVLGSGVTFAELARSEVVARLAPVLAEAAATVAGPQIRNVATLGGNLCNGAPSADSAAPLLVLNASLVLRGPEGEREVRLEDFYEGPGRVRRDRAELLTAVRIGLSEYRGWSACYRKYSMRGAMDIATVGCAAAFKLEGGVVSDLRLAYTVAGPKPLRCPKAEAKARGARADEDLLKLLAACVLDDLSPRDSWRASKEFREHIIVTLAERVSREALRRGGAPL
jgi:xanthine dehydrogenase FAD-binding subunit